MLSVSRETNAILYHMSTVFLQGAERFVFFLLVGCGLLLHGAETLSPVSNRICCASSVTLYSLH